MANALRHETAVSWIHAQLIETTPFEAWKETRAAHIARLKQECENINNTFDVQGLCKPVLAMLIDRLTN